MKRENKDLRPIYYKDPEEMEKPLSELMESLRNDVSMVRGKLHDIRNSFGWEDRITHIEGGLTCLLIAMHSTMIEWKQFEEKHYVKSKENGGE